jgi:dihydrofolate synthase/folylpolyglutamate synthase
MALQLADRFLDLPKPALFGAHQIENAAVAAVAMMALDRRRGTQAIDDDAIAEGLTRARWPARMQRLVTGPLAASARARGIELWLDGGHNPHGALAIERALTALRAETPRPTWVILGVLNRKDLDGVVAPLARVADAIVAVPVPNSAASRDPIEVRAAVAARGTSALIAATCDEALASAPAGSRVLICGSLYLAGAVLAENDPPV